MTSFLEHANITVPDPEKTSELLCRLFDWKIRWAGKSLNGRSSHVGNENTYLALYRQETIETSEKIDTYETSGAMNHLGIVVGDIDLTEERVRAEGFVPTNHGDYEPGRRFYFDLPERIEIEVISYA